MPQDYLAARAAAAAAAALPPRIEAWIDYARKSSEGKERQALSIPSQLEQTRSAFPDLPRQGDPIRESKSAFRPGRPKFNALIEQIDAGIVTGIIAWHPNRLARNAADAATIIHLLQEGKLDLRFVTYHFEKTPEGILLLQHMLSQGQYESARLARDVNRGMGKKVELGWYPGALPIGYKTDGDRRRKGTRTVKTDDGRLSIVERGMRYALTGNYTISELHHLMATDWGLRTRTTEKRKSVPVGYNIVLNMFRNVFYTGHFLWKGQLYEGKHKGIITLDQYLRLQEIVRHRAQGDTRRTLSRTYARFSGLMKCGLCGRAITATEKRKHYAGTNRDALYIYYHCSRGTTRRFCAERPLSEPKLIDAILVELADFRMITKFRDQAIEWLISNFQAKQQDRSAEQKEHREELARLESRDQGLTDMRAAGEIDSDDYAAQHSRYKKHIGELKKLLVKDPDADWNKLVSSVKTIHFAAGLKAAFLASDETDQRRSLIELADSVVIERGKVLIKAKKWLQPLRRSFTFEDAWRELDRTSKNGSPKEKMVAFVANIHLWCRIFESIADLISEELERGKTVHTEVQLPADLQARLNGLRPKND